MMTALTKCYKNANKYTFLIHIKFLLCIIITVFSPGIFLVIQVKGVRCMRINLIGQEEGG